jgi:hypothetical protein
MCGRSGIAAAAASFSTLAAATEAPARIQFQRVDEEAGFELFLPVMLRRLPAELHVEARRFPRRIEAYWNGCAWIV